MSLRRLRLLFVLSAPVRFEVMEAERRAQINFDVEPDALFVPPIKGGTQDNRYEARSLMTIASGGLGAGTVTRLVKHRHQVKNMFRICVLPRHI
jgi:hypothetical protein